MEKVLENDKQTTIRNGLDKINSFEGGNALFYSKFKKSRSVVSNWRNGKVVPSEQNIEDFLRVTTSVIRECQEAKRKRIEKRDRLMQEFQTLVSA